jgi:hypothetical protein
LRYGFRYINILSNHAKKLSPYVETGILPLQVGLVCVRLVLRPESLQAMPCTCILLQLENMPELACNVPNGLAEEMHTMQECFAAMGIKEAT